MSQHSGRFAVVVLAVLALVCPVFAGGEGFEGIRERVRYERLENGLRLILLEDHDAPVVSCFTLVGVGGADEHVGITGVAHVFEHMAFKGTNEIGAKNYAKEQEIVRRMDAVYEEWIREKMSMHPDPEKIAALETKLADLQEQEDALIDGNAYSKILEKAGAQGLNAFTSADVTGYLVNLPANQLELWAVLESERFLHPVLRQFYKEKQVILEERRMRTENQPTGKLIEVFLSTAFVAHPYKEPIIGHKSDIEFLRRTDAAKFYEKHYIPSKIIVSIVGDFDSEEVLPMLRKYFSRLPAGEKARPVSTIEPPQEGERRVSIESAAQPIWVAAYHRPSVRHPDDPVYDALADLLGGGRTSRLYKRLVKEEKVATSVSVGNGWPGSRFPNLLLVFGVPAMGHTAEEVETLVDEEIRKLIEEGITDEEMEKVRARAKVNFIQSFDSNMGMAQSLAYNEFLMGDWRDLFETFDRISAVTKEDIVRVAGETMVKRNRTVGTIVSK